MEKLEMEYSAGYFKEQMPDWKRKKDPILSRIFYRQVSFKLAAILANHNISANSVSYFSAILGIIACFCFLLSNWTFHVIGAVLINIWLILDCTDGNLARSVKKQPFGEFADGISSYILVGLMCSAMGITVFHEGGLFFHPGQYLFIYIGALASSADTLMRLIYQKYKATERELADSGIIKIEKDARTDHSQVRNLKVRIESELGIGGLLPLFILLASIFKALDLVVIYCFLYYVSSCLIASLIFIKKAILKSNNLNDFAE